MGIELEGGFESEPYDDRGNFKEDGSIHDLPISNNYDDCECFTRCECNSCLICTNCEYHFESCECDCCLMCADCENNFEDCDCEIEKLSSCEDKNCTKNEVCEDCRQDFHDNQTLEHNCDLMGNVEYRCENDGSCDCCCECSSNYIGEMVSKPLRIDEIEKFIMDFNPDYINKTCGSHVHISFTNELSYSMIMTLEFYEYFKKEMVKFGHDVLKLPNDHDYFTRFRGVYYCKDQFIPECQKNIHRSYDHDRYTIINYCYHVRNRKTAEFRVISAFDDPTQLKQVVRKMYNLINEYLVKNDNDMWIKGLSCNLEDLNQHDKQGYTD